MALPAPNLDDRRFQELVDEAKRMVMRRCPEWTDHNVSDPGVTLIETFAYMTDLMLYRLNRVPDRLYVKFLDLIGLQLFPPTAGRAPVTFWLSTAIDQPMTIPVATRVATLRTEHEESEVFTTIEDLALIPCAYQATMTQAAGGEALVDRTEQMHLQPIAAFSDRPSPGDALMIALTEAIPSNAVSLRVRCRIDGVGVDPTNPPLAWEAYDGTAWQECDLERDDTGGLNRDGEIVIHVPSSHRAGVFDGVRAGWIRCVVTKAEEGQPEYSSSPIVHGIEAGTVGGTADAVHAEVFVNEALGISDGTPGQRFEVVRTPILSGTSSAELDVGGDDGWESWTEIAHFASSGPTDKHFRLDAVTGEVCFGPAVREQDGALRQYGAVPPTGSAIRLSKYAVGGGRRGNVAKGAIRTLKTAIPFVAAVENRKPATGGVDGETIEEAKIRGPILLRTRNRAVTAEDFEQITREAAPEIARVRCVSAGAGPESGSVKVLVVPAAPMVRGKIRFEDLIPNEETLQKIQDRLEQARLIGTRVLIEPPMYRGVTVVAMLRARPRMNANRIRDDALERLESYFNPLVGGPDGRGWPWGRPVQAGEAYAALQEIRGVDLVEEIRVFGANPVTGERGQASQRIEVEPTSLVFSYEHQVRVQEP